MQYLTMFATAACCFIALPSAKAQAPAPNKSTLKCPTEDISSPSCKWENSAPGNDICLVVVQGQPTPSNIELRLGAPASPSVQTKGTLSDVNDLCFKIETSPGQNYHLYDNSSKRASTVLAVAGESSAPVTETSDDEVKKEEEAVVTCVNSAPVLTTAHKFDHDVLFGPAEVVLYFTPDGRSVAPLPTNLNERDEIRIEILMPKDARANGMRTDTKVSFSACPDRNPRRVQGDWGKVTGSFQTSLACDELKLVPIRAADVTCGAGQVAFSIATPYGTATHTLTLAPVYWGTFGAQFTFDFTGIGGYELTRSGDVTSIRERDDVIGPGLVPVFITHPFGYDLERASILGVLINPTIGFDLGNMLDSFYVGDSVCFYGYCLTAGVHFRKSERLTAASGLKVGDTFAGELKDLPTEKVWTKGSSSNGLYIGATIDILTFAALVGE